MNSTLKRLICWQCCSTSSEHQNRKPEWVSSIVFTFCWTGHFASC